MTDSEPTTRPMQDERPHDLLNRLRAAGADKMDPVGWHYIEVLAERTSAQSGPVQALLLHKLSTSLIACQARLRSAPPHPESPEDPLTVRRSSPLAALLQDMAYEPEAGTATTRLSPRATESPRVRQLRQQLGRIGVQKQVSRAMASGPQNAGPINSHMLVLRAMGRMRDISPEYLNRFMVHLDTLLCLHDELHQPAPVPRPARARKTTRG